MPIVILFLVIAVVVSLAGVFMNPNRDVSFFSESSQQEEQVSADKQQSYQGTSQNKTQNAPKTQTPSQTAPQEKGAVDPDFPINTYIKYGPVRQDIFEDTNEVLFEFDAVVSGQVKKEDVYFETKITGLDNDWVRTNENEREVKFPAGAREYVFWVRGRTDSLTEPTPANRTVKINISPYFGKVEIDAVNRPAPNSPSLIKLNTRLGGSETINITNWKLQAFKGYFLIPQGVETYQMSAASNIYIKSGDTVYISSDENPFGGENNSFRTNKCMGYLNNSYNFKISIDKNCPMPEAKKLPNYVSNDCEKYIMSLDRCEQTTYQGMQEYKLLEDSSCQAYLNSRFNYAGCLAYYSQDSDFKGNQWHVYTNRRNREIMDVKDDTVYLYDQQGLFIDSYCYGDRCSS